MNKPIDLWKKIEPTLTPKQKSFLEENPRDGQKYLSKILVEDLWQENSYLLIKEHPDKLALLILGDAFKDGQHRIYISEKNTLAQEYASLLNGLLKDSLKDSNQLPFLYFKTLGTYKEFFTLWKTLAPEEVMTPKLQQKLEEKLAQLPFNAEEYLATIYKTEVLANAIIEKHGREFDAAYPQSNHALCIIISDHFKNERHHLYAVKDKNNLPIDAIDNYLKSSGLLKDPQEYFLPHLKPTPEELKERE